MKDKGTIAVATLATVICFTVVGVVVYRYFNPVPPGEQLVSLAGEEQPQKVTRDMPLSEAG